MKKHYTQLIRSENIALIERWVKNFREEHGEEAEIDRRQLSIKIQKVIGAAGTKAEEYINLVLGEQ